MPLDPPVTSAITFAEVSVIIASYRVIADEFGAALGNGSPQHIGFTAQHHKHLIGMPGTARFEPSKLEAMRRFVTHHHAAFEQQLFNVARGQLKLKVAAIKAAVGLDRAPPVGLRS